MTGSRHEDGIRRRKIEWPHRRCIVESNRHRQIGDPQLRCRQGRQTFPLRISDSDKYPKIRIQLDTFRQPQLDFYDRSRIDILSAIRH